MDHKPVRTVIYCVHTRELLIAILYYLANKNVIIVVRLSVFLPDKLINNLLLIFNDELNKTIFIVDDRGSTGYLRAKVHSIILSLWLTYRYQIGTLIIFNDAHSISNLMKRKKILLFEHGFINYQNEKNSSISVRSLLKRIKNFIFFESEPSYGRSTKVDEVHLFNPDKAPKELINKVKKLQLISFWKELSCEEKIKICNLFGLELLSIPNREQIQNILITQPLSEDGLISEVEKVKLYSFILKKYIDNNETVLLKKHPRETTDYSSFLKTEYVVELGGVVPFELLSLVGIKFERVITIFSSVINSFDYELEVVFLGREYINQWKEIKIKKS